MSTLEHNRNSFILKQLETRLPDQEKKVLELERFYLPICRADEEVTSFTPTVKASDVFNTKAILASDVEERYQSCRDDFVNSYIVGLIEACFDIVMYLRLGGSAHHIEKVINKASNMLMPFELNEKAILERLKEKNVFKENLEITKCFSLLEREVEKQRGRMLEELFNTK